MMINLKKIGCVIVMAALFPCAGVYAQARFQDGYYVTRADDRQRGNPHERGGDSRGQTSSDRSYDSGRQAEREQPRRDPRMSADERRALRQQIDEAGRDIYAPRRGKN